MAQNKVLAMPAPPAKQYFAPLTGVRAVMMYAVFNCHFNLVYPEVFGESAFRFAREWHVGVPVFYVLSGFLIHYRYADDLRPRQRAWLGRYLQNRAARIYPVYFLVLLVTYLVQGFPDGRTTWVTFTLTQSFFPDLTKAGIGQAWTLTIEETFYLLAPLLFWLAARGTAIAPCLALWGLGILLAAVPGSPYYGLTGHVLGRTLCGAIGCFAAGIALARAVRRLPAELPKRPGAWFTYLGFAASVAVVLGVSRLGFWVDPATVPDKVPRGADHPWGAVLIFTLFPVCVAIWFYGLLRESSALARLLGSRLLVLLGRSSYCFYLIHLGVVQQWVDHRILEPWLSNHALRVLGLFLAINLLAVALFRGVEHPLNEFFKRLGRSPDGANRVWQWQPGRGLSFAFLALLLAAGAVPWCLRVADQPQWLERLLAEDGPYETAQALLGLAAALAFAARGLAPRHRASNAEPGRPGNPGRFGWCLAALLSLVMLGEEISWGQRLLGWQLPLAWRQENFQAELTLHNWRWFQTSSEGNLLQLAWLGCLTVGLGLVPWLPAERLAGWARRWGIPLASRGMSLAWWGVLAAHAGTGQSSEVLELQTALCWLALALRPGERGAQAGWVVFDRTLAAWALVLPLGLVALLLQAGESALPARQSAQWIDAGVKHLQAGNPDEARRAFETALEIWPQDADAHFNLAQLDLLAKHWPQAIVHLRETTRFRADDREAWRQLAGALLTTGRTAEALAALERAETLDSQDLGIRLLKAQAYQALGDRAGALAEFRLVLAAPNPPALAQNAAAWHLATDAHSTPADRRLALDWAEGACQATNYQNPGYLDTLAAAQAALGRFSDAVTWAERAVELAAAQQPQRREAIARRLEGYRQGLAYTEP